MGAWATYEVEFEQAAALSDYHLRFVNGNEELGIELRKLTVQDGQHLALSPERGSAPSAVATDHPIDGVSIPGGNGKQPLMQVKAFSACCSTAIAALPPNR